MRIPLSPSRRPPAARTALLRLPFLAAVLLATCLLPSSSAIGLKPGGSPLPFAIMVEGVGVGVSEEVAGVKATADAYVDPDRPTSSRAGACLGFEPGGKRLVPGVDQDGALVMVYVGFLGPSNMDMVSGGSSNGADSSADAPEGKGFPVWVYVADTPLPRTAPQELSLPAPPGTSWGTWEAGYSPSNCP